MKNNFNITLLLLFTFLFVNFVFVESQVTISQITVTPTNLDQYAFDTTCTYRYRVYFSAPNGDTVTVTSPTAALFAKNIYDLTFTQSTGTSGKLTVKTEDSTSTYDFDLDNFECLATPFIEYDTTQQLRLSNYYTFSYTLKITNAVPLVKYLDTRLSGKVTTDLTYISQITVYGQYQIYDIGFLIGSDPTEYGNSIKLTIQVSQAQAIIIDLALPFVQANWIGTFSSVASKSPYESSYGVILNYAQNTNNNTIVGIESTNLNIRVTEGNEIEGSRLQFYNRRGTLAYAVNSRGAGFRYIAGSTGSTALFYSGTFNLLAIPQLVTTGYGTSYIDSTSDTSITFLNVVYNTASKVYDRTHFMYFKKGTMENYQYATFPFGYTNGNIGTGYKIAFSFPTFGAFNYYIYLTVSYNAQQSYLRSSSNPVTAAPTITDFRLIGKLGNKKIYRFNYQNPAPFTKANGYYTINDASNPLFGTSAQLMNGTLLDGTYEIQQNIGGLEYLRAFNDVGYYTNMRIPDYSKAVPTFLDFKGISFSANDIDLTDATQPYKVRVYLNFTDPNFMFQFLIYEQIGTGGAYLYDPIFYDFLYYPEAQLYITDIELQPRRRSGPLYYRIYSYGFFGPLTTSMFETTYPSYILRTFSRYIDEMPPYVSAITTNPPTGYTISGTTGTTTLSFTITINDKYNGLKNGTIWIASDLDPVGYNFTITPANVLSGGNQYIGSYLLSFEINNRCKSQTYLIKDMTLFDNSNVIASMYSPSTNIYYLDPIIDATKNVLNIICSDTPENVPPTLTTFVIKTVGPIDVSLPNQYVDVEFIVQDNDSGIDENRPPTVYVSAASFAIASARSVSQGSGVFTARVPIPYGMGLNGGIYFSVYGIIDYHLNFNGYSSSDLQTMSQDYHIATFTTFSPTIFEASYRSEYGPITLTGSNFGLDPVITRAQYTKSLSSTQWYSTTTFGWKSNNYLTFKLNNFTEPFKVRVTKDGQLSNEFIVYPILPFLPPEPWFPIPEESSSEQSSSQSSSHSQSSNSGSIDSSSSHGQPNTPTPKSCPGNPPCSGHGVCLSNGCLCNDDYSGLDCSSKVIIIPPITPDPNKPNSGNQINGSDSNGITYNTLVSINSLLELDSTGNIVNNVTFNQWQYSNISTLDRPYYYSYNYTFVQDNMNVTVTALTQYFEKATTITFANQQMQMKPSSIKYNVGLTPYPFKSSFNTLQLIFSAQITANDKESCSFSTSGSVGDDDEYVQLQVNDHSLYGRFIKRAMIDGKTTSITNTFKGNDNSASTSTQYIGMNIPFYKESAELDPDFSVLLDNKPASDQDDNICYEKSSKLTTPQLAGIIIGSVCFAGVVAASVTYVIIKKKKQRNFEKKLSKMNN